MEADLKSEVRARWTSAGRPQWSAAQTLAVAEEADDAFAEVGKNPAPRFHEERQRRNESYLDAWIGGCHFEWLNPRPQHNHDGERQKPRDRAVLLEAVTEALDHVDAACQSLNAVDLPVIENEAHTLRMRLEELWQVLGGREDSA